MPRSTVRRLSSSVAGAALVVLCASPPAPAATLSAEPSPRDPTYETIAYYTAAPGEVNRLLVTRVDDYTIRVADPGAVITTSGRCTSIDAHTAQCSSPGPQAGAPNWFLRTVVAGGDMDDEIRSDGVGLEADAGAGSDTIAVDAVIASTLNGGGGGRDQLFGGDNTDTLSDGDLSGATDADVLDGRGSGDMVSYAQRTAPVAVDLGDEEPDGEAGEGDVLRSIESAEGGAGDDELSGTDEFTNLEGGAGDDELKGRAGNDILDGGDGEDVVLAGRGEDIVDGGDGDDELFGERDHDVLLARSGGDDDVSCGRGEDTAAGPRRGDLLQPDCEEARFSFGDEDLDALSATAYPTRRDRASVAFRLGCPTFDDLDGESRPVAGPVRIRESGGRRRLLGRGEITRALGRRCGNEAGSGRLSVRVDLTRLGRRLAGRRRGVQATVSLRGRNLPSVAWTIRLATR